LEIWNSINFSKAFMSKFSPLNGVTKAVIDPLNIVIKYKNLYIGLLHD
jgi:hypothetical protein